MDTPNIDPDILANNTEAVKNFVRTGMSLAEAVQNLKTMLIANGTNPSEAERRANEAGEDARRQQSNVYVDRDPRISVGPRTESENWYFEPTSGGYLWPRYRDLLLKQRGLSEKTVQELDEATTRIVGQLGCPGASRFRKQGLVVGRVQSGKTSNFMGLLAKAGDAGYRIIIILAGTTNSLRYQTQDRLQKDLIGFNDTEWGWETHANCDPITFIVDKEGEFKPLAKINATQVMASQNSRRIMVIKKNAIVLKRVRRWFQGVSDGIKELCPVLIVDDECDSASVNTRKPGADPAAINGEIRDILQLLPKVSYVGYTATPFANVLINPSEEEQDLYPRDFLFPIPLNKEYFGPEKIFGRDPLSLDDNGDDGNDIVRLIPEDDVSKVCPESRNVIDGFDMTETESMTDAIRYFLMSTAARCYREQKNSLDADFKSMLVNTSQYTKIHFKTEVLVRKIVLKLTSRFETEKGRWKQQWEDENLKFTQDSIGCQHDKVTWDNVLNFLTKEFFSSVEIIISNSDPNRASNLNSRYDRSRKGAVQIVIGGNTLSRGITLEGLCVSYFVRGSTNYDTLLQMGRWFGYRKNYEDMPRIWMTKEMQDKFLELSAVEYEMFQELLNFSAGQSPSEIGLRIRKSPGMQVTAKAKMYHAVDCDINYEGTCVQTIFVHRNNINSLDSNKQCVEELINSTGGASTWIDKQGFWLNRDINAEVVLNFLDKYIFHEKNKLANRSILTGFIKNKNTYNECKLWNIAIKTKTKNLLPGDDMTLGGLKINKLQISRVSGIYDNADFAYLKAIKSRNDIFADAENPAELTKRCNTEKDFVRERMNYENGRGLIVVYPIRADSKPNEHNKTRRDNLNAAADVFGLAIFYPGAKSDRSGLGYVTVNIQPTQNTNIEEDFEVEPDV